MASYKTEKIHLCFFDILIIMKTDIIKLLDELKIKYQWIDHPAVFTVNDLSNLPENIKPIKNLLIQEEGGGKKYLVVMAGNARLDLKSFRESLSIKRLCFANSETLLQTFGVKSGAVSIFGFINNKSADVEVVVDEEILNSSDALGFHPNDNTATILFNPNNLDTLLKSMGCNYRIMKLY
jgi:Ala-tRNA(Pro) deacylase